MEHALGVSEKRFEDHLIALDGGADFLLEDPDDFFGRLVLEAGERARSGC